MKKSVAFIKRILWVVSAGFIVSTATAADVEKITIDELKGMLDNPDIVVVDVRTSTDWGVSDSKIRGAVREAPENVADWSSKYDKDTTLIFY